VTERGVGGVGDEGSGVSGRGWARDITVGAIATIPAMFAAMLRPLFHDEASTWMSAGASFTKAFAAIREDIHPPVYPLIAWFVRNAGAPSYMTLRLLSLVFLGAAVAVFLHALRSATGKTLRVTEALLVTSPFLAFAGYFARYYTLAMLVAAVALWVAVEHLKRPTVLRAAAMGVCAGALFLVNYLAAFTLAPLMAWAVWRGARSAGRDAEREAGVGEGSAVGAAVCMMGFAACAALIAAPWMALFLHQMKLESAARAAAGTPSGIRTIPLAAAITVYNFAVGDGLPPWVGTNDTMLDDIHNVVKDDPFHLGITVLSVLLSAFVALTVAATGTWCAVLGMRDAWRARRWYRAATVAAAAAIGLGIALGSLGLPGSRCVFLPPRAAFLYYAWVLPLVALPEALCSLTRRRACALVTVNTIGLVGLLALGGTTVWAYRLPLDRICDGVSDFLRAPKDAPEFNYSFSLFLPSDSLKNVLLALQKRRSMQDVNQKPARAVERVLVINEMSRPAWPPSAAVGTPVGLDPTSTTDYKEDGFQRFVPEPLLVWWLKRHIAGRTAEPYKIILRGYSPE
jgi:hypothetical protein